MLELLLAMAIASAEVARVPDPPPVATVYVFDALVTEASFRPRRNDRVGGGDQCVIGRLVLRIDRQESAPAEGDRLVITPERIGKGGFCNLFRAYKARSLVGFLVEIHNEVSAEGRLIFHVRWTGERVQ